MALLVSRWPPCVFVKNTDIGRIFDVSCSTVSQTDQEMMKPEIGPRPGQMGSHGRVKSKNINMKDLTPMISAHHPRLWSGRFGQGDRCDRQSLPFSKPEAGAQDGRIGSGRLPERGNLEYGLPGHFQKGKSRSALCLIPLNFKTWIRDDGRPPRAGCRILMEFTLSLSKG